MIALDLLATFIAASALLALVPGPDNIFVLTQAALYGRLAGVCITLGLCSGLVIHTAAVAFGLAALIQTTPIAFTILKVAGALYLIYLAWQAWRANYNDSSLAVDGNSADTHTPTLKSLYLRGFVMNVSNPKVAIFFLAFLPQFIGITSTSPAIQIILLGVVFMLVAFIIFTTIALLAGFLGEWMRRKANVECILNRIAGVIFLGLALKLVFAEAF